MKARDRYIEELAREFAPIFKQAEDLSIIDGAVLRAKRMIGRKSKRLKDATLERRLMLRELRFLGARDGGR